MTATYQNWRAVQDEVLRRIRTRIWQPGDLIPNETDLAAEFRCARTTVNRALRTLADTGILDRRRKAGTRLAMHPVRKATLDIPVIRIEIENGGYDYGYSLIKREMKRPGPDTRDRMQLDQQDSALHIVALHMANGKPYVLEDRWINIAVLPDARHIDFKTISPNEWLVLNASFTSGDIVFSAASAKRHEAEVFGVQKGTAMFVTGRRTWSNDAVITSVRLVYAPGYRMRTNI